MRHGSLFSGIGGFDLAAQWIGWENVFQVEWDEYCQKVLAKNFPNVKRYGDIKEFNGSEYRGAVDILSGGFPCQPFSVAGKRKGKEDDRYLWPEYLRVIREIKPAYVVGENVLGIINMELDNIITDLESEGYVTEQFIIPAIGLEARHKRYRLWIIAYAKSIWPRRLQNKSQEEGTQDSTKLFRELCRNISDSDSERGCSRDSTGQYANNAWELSASKRFRCWDIEPSVGRVANGIPRRVDRLKGLGNAIVPQVAYEIFKVIEQFNNSI
ncbi:MAG: DNA (cytosine-5-)-methyltransferase [Rikenellaceae bacterium]